MEQAKEFIRQHYRESDLSVERLCAHLHLSPASVSYTHLAALMNGIDEANGYNVDKNEDGTVKVAKIRVPYAKVTA